MDETTVGRARSALRSDAGFGLPPRHARLPVDKRTPRGPAALVLGPRVARLSPAGESNDLAGGSRYSFDTATAAHYRRYRVRDRDHLAVLRPRQTRGRVFPGVAQAGRARGYSHQFSR